MHNSDFDLILNIRKTNPFLSRKIKIAYKSIKCYNVYIERLGQNMSKVLGKIRDYFCYCGITKEEYDAIKKDVYVSNFVIWRVLHALMTIVFGALFINALISNALRQNLFFYLGLFIYSTVSFVLFLFVFRKGTLIAQLYIYLSAIALFIFGALITANAPEASAVTFMVFLVIIPMTLLHKPYYMSVVLVIVSVVFLFWMRAIKTDDVWIGDLVNTITFCVVGMAINIISNSVRIREFVLRRKLNIQKDEDDLTGLMNKGALTRSINEFLQTSVNKGILFVLDIDDFKEINDKYGHDAGDDVLRQVGEYLANKIGKDKIVGRFGGDEFIVMIEGDANLALASNLARDIIADFKKYIKTPDPNDLVNVTIGIAIYRGDEGNYSEIFKKADTALYIAKNEGKDSFRIY